MSTYSVPKNRRKYRVYIGETFRWLSSYKTIVESITRAGLLYYSADEVLAIHKGFEEELQREMNDADIYLLLLSNRYSHSETDGEILTGLEYHYARTTGKPILVYFFTDERSEEWEKKIGDLASIVKTQETYTIVNDENDLPSIISADLFAKLLNEQNQNSWVRSDINYAKVDSIAHQKFLADTNLLQASRYIQLYENNLDSKKRDQIIGPIVAAGLRPNTSGQAYRFAIKHTPEDEIKHDDLKYQYCVDRFTLYQGGAVYDRLLDVTWLLIQDQAFSWHSAQKWKEKLLPQNLERVSSFQSSPEAINENNWRLPTIEELMTLLTEQKQDEDYFDKVVFPGDVHWFWSSTLAKRGKKAYYIETTQGKVLQDELEHQNAVILCLDGKPKKLGGLFHVTEQLSIAKGAESLRQAVQSRHIYGVFASICASDQVGNNLVKTLQNALHKGGYAVTCTITELARTIFKQGIIQNELENHDGYVLILDRSLMPEMLKVARSELIRVRNLGIPVFIYHNFSENSSFEWKEKLELSNDETVGLQKYKDATTLVSDTVSALSHYLGPDTSLGWIRSSTFQTINQSIEKINQTRVLLDTSEHLVDAFIENCNVEGLRQAFENCGIVAEKPKYGEQSWFISKDNPIQRFFPQDELSHDYELPVLFEKLPNRFEILFEDENRLILFDHYLNLKWWTLGLKKTSFDEAISYAKTISQQTDDQWRIPTIEEMATLITRSRINRKYMDERLFPKGRWFWTASRIGEIVYYIDYNYLMGAIRRENLSLYKEEFPVFRKKSVILVSVDSKANQKTHRSAQDKSDKPMHGEKSMDPFSISVLLKTVDFLFDEVSKILSERREYRKEQTAIETKTSSALQDTPVEESVNTKEDLKLLNVDENVWLDRRKEVEHLTKLLQNYTSTYYIVKEQIAKYGEADAPPIKIHQREDALKGIVDTTEQLEKVLSDIYGKKITVSAIEH